MKIERIDNLLPERAHPGALSWIFTYPDVQSLETITTLAKDADIMPVEHLCSILNMEWKNHNQFDTLPTLPDAPEENIRFSTLQFDGTHIFLADPQNEWKTWITTVAQACGSYSGLLATHLHLATFHHGTSQERLDQLHLIVRKSETADFGRPRLTLARLANREMGFEWRKIRSVAPLTKAEREEIESSYRI